MPFIAFKTISFKSLGTDATKPLNFNKRQFPRPLFNVVSHFSSGLMCFSWSNIDWGRGAVLCVKSVMIHFESKTICVPTTSECNCLGAICHNTIVYLKSTGARMLCERSISAPFRSQKI
jgi:hypothetical protein